MQTITDFNEATIILSNYLSQNNDKTPKLFSELSDGEKQNIADVFISQYIYTNCSYLVSELLTHDIEDHEELLSIAQSYNYENYAIEHVKDLEIEELFELLEHNDLLDNIDQKYIIDRLDEKEFKEMIISDEITMSDLKDYSLSEFITYINYLTELDNIRTDLAEKIINAIDLDEYGQENDLNYDIDETYEFYIVNDYFSELVDNCAEVMNLTIWGRRCTNQSICLDYNIQKVAFSLYSNLDYSAY